MNVQDRLSAMLGVAPASRVPSLVELYQATERHPAAYWLQLAIAAGIAHLGLVLNSTGVVIGAMLVSPLMTPIVQVGVSFSIGHPFLTARAALRTAKSIVFVVGLAALMTRLLPFQEVTAEILARTQPTALDLAVALFCGLAAAFTTARNANDVFTAAAGTAIAISLVPPLCVAGFGIGTANTAVATGSLLLFTANLSAIILVTDVFFLALGFGRAHSGQMESEALKEEDRNTRLYRFFRSPGPARVLTRWHHLRLILPLLFVGIVAFPLGVALERVTWEVNTRKRVAVILDEFEKANRVVRRQSTVSHGAVSVRLTVVGSPAREAALREDLRKRLATAAGCQPSLALEVVPSSEFMNRTIRQSSEQLNRQLAELRYGTGGNGNDAPGAVSSATPFTAVEAAARERCRAFFAWLRETDPAAGWIGWTLSIREEGPVLALRRLAAPTAPPADAALLAAVFARETGLPVTLQEERFPAEVFVSTKPLSDAADLEKGLRLFDSIPERKALHVRLELRDPAGARGAAARRAWTRANEGLARRVQERVSAANLEIVTDSPRWALTLSAGHPVRQAKEEDSQ